MNIVLELVGLAVLLAIFAAGLLYIIKRFITKEKDNAGSK